MQTETETQTPTETALWQRGALELGAAITRGEVSSREVVDAHLERIEEINPRVNALHATLAEQARADAAHADRLLASDATVGPLHGVPFSVKENVDVANTATTWGLAAMAEAVSPDDAPVVANLRAAGAIPISRGNMPDFALRWHTDNDLMGATRNPWDPSRTPGGSSAGEAVALATGMAPLAVGNDLGGSLRWPSQCAGTAALRPSHGRVPDASSIPPTDSPPTIQLFNSQGPMARRVEDLRVAFAAMIAPSPRDPWHIPAPAAGLPLDGPVRVCVALPEGTDPTVADGVRRAADALAGAGYDTREDLPPGVEEAATLWAELLNEDVRRFWPMVEPIVSDGARRFTASALSASPVLDVEGYAMRWQARQALARRWSVYQAERPLILAPVFLERPFAVGADIADPESAARIAEPMKMVVAVNLLGLPAAALPAGLDPDGLPLGVQIIGPRFREDLCLDAAAAIEGAVGTLTPIEPRGSV
jgi:amidase